MEMNNALLQMEHSHRFQAMEYVRAIAVLFVVAMHAWIAYSARIPLGLVKFGGASHLWEIVPVADSQHWFGADAIISFTDSWAMPLMFLLSGLFVQRSLAVRGTSGFIKERIRRIGLPFAISAALMPIAYYPSYWQLSAGHGVSAFIDAWRSTGIWPIGPAWFMGVLLAFNMIAIFALAGERHLSAVKARGLHKILSESPLKVCIAVLLISAAIYVPVALAFPAGAKWFNFGPLMFQPNRLGHYFVYFAFGLLLGSTDLETTVSAVDGKFARSWPVLLVMTLGIFITLLAVLNGAPGKVPPVRKVVTIVGYVVMGGLGTFCVLACCIRLGGRSFRILGSIGSNAFGIYLTHYFFVTWTQFALLSWNATALTKGLVVFVAATFASWFVTELYAAVVNRRKPVAARNSALGYTTP
jgi:peptidoglycan/LPS O-acetylase OafA/YrhL